MISIVAWPSRALLSVGAASPTNSFIAARHSMDRDVESTLPIVWPPMHMHDRYDDDSIRFDGVENAKGNRQSMRRRIFSECLAPKYGRFSADAIVRSSSSRKSLPNPGFRLS